MSNACPILESQTQPIWTKTGIHEVWLRSDVRASGSNHSKNIRSLPWWIPGKFWLTCGQIIMKLTAKKLILLILRKLISFKNDWVNYKHGNGDMEILLDLNSKQITLLSRYQVSLKQISFFSSGNICYRQAKIDGKNVKTPVTRQSLEKSRIWREWEIITRFFDTIQPVLDTMVQHFRLL